MLTQEEGRNKVENEQSSRFRKEILNYLKKQDYGSVSLGPLRSNQQGNEQLASILMDMKTDLSGEKVESLGSLGKELAEKLDEINQEAIMGSAADQSVLHEQLKAFQSMIPLLEESTAEQRAAKKALDIHYRNSANAMKQNGKLYNRLVEGAKSMLPAASGFLTAMTAKSPIAGAMVNFALEKFQERGKRKDDAQKDSFKALVKSFDSITFSDKKEKKKKEKKERVETAQAAKTPTANVPPVITSAPSSNKPVMASVSEPQDPNSISPERMLSPAEALASDPEEFKAGLGEGIGAELENLNEDELNVLRTQLAELFGVTEEELETLDQIKQLLVENTAAEMESPSEDGSDPNSISPERLITQVNESSPEFGEPNAGFGEDGVVIELGALRTQLADLYGLTEEELSTIEQIKQILEDSTSNEEDLEAERRAAAQGRFLKGGEGKEKSKGGLGGMLADFLGLADIKAAFDIVKKGASAKFFGSLIKVGKFFARWALPLTLAISIGKGLYDGVKKWQSGAGIWEAIKTGLTSTGDLIIDIFTFGHGKQIKDWISEKGSSIIDPIFKAYDSIVSWISDTMTSVMDTIEKAKNAIKSIIGGAVKLFKDVEERGMDAVFDRLTGNDTSQGAADAAQAASDKASRDKKRRASIKAEMDVQKAKDIWAPIDNTSPAKAATPELRQAALATSTPVPSSQMAQPQTSPMSISDTQTSFIDSLKSQGITDPNEVSNVLAQVQAESGFKPRSESMNYKATRLFDMFGKGNAGGNKVRFETVADAQKVIDQGPEAVGNTIYGGRMGNAPDEGFKYRGRGLHQLTGKDNYQKYGDKIGVDLVNNPDMANDPKIAAQLASVYFAEAKQRGTNLGDINSIGKAVGYAGGPAETRNRANLAEGFKSQLGQMSSSGTSPALDSTAIPSSDAKVDRIETASTMVKESETQSRALVASRNSTPGGVTNNVIQQTSNNSGGGGGNPGLTRSYNVDPTLRHQSPVLA